MSSAYASAVSAWSALLNDGEYARFMQTNWEAVISMAVALAQPEAENALDWETVRQRFPTDEAEQMLLSLVFVVQELLEVIIRENMAFLTEDTARSSSDSTSTSSTSPDDHRSASQRDAVAHQDALLQKLPERFRLAFIKTLRSHWASLRDAAVQQNVTLTRLVDMSWRVARPYVLMRIITSDQKRRILKIPMQQFHQLRYSTAKVLQEMNQVEAHPIMRLTTLEQSKTQTGRVGLDSTTTTARSQKAAP